MAASCTITEDKSGGLHKIKFDWQSASDGTCSGTTTSYYNGFVRWAAFDPDASSTQPTDQYDVTVTDSDGLDVLDGNGTDLSNAANAYAAEKDGLGAVQSSKLTLSVAGAGDTKGGIVYLFIEPTV